MKRAARGFSRIGMFGEEMPNIENRIELASDKDEFGMPLGRLIHSYDQTRPQLWECQLCRRAGDRQGSGREGDVGPGAPQYSDHPPDGGTIMGTGRGELGGQQLRAEPRDCRTSTWRGPASSPTSGASNPTYTIFALSLRGAEQLATKWATVAG